MNWKTKELIARSWQTWLTMDAVGVYLQETIRQLPCLHGSGPSEINLQDVFIIHK